MPPCSARTADTPPVITTTDVDRAAADVFAYATDPARFHEWQAGVTEGHLDRPGPVEAGARCLTTRRIGGANRAVAARDIYPMAGGPAATP